jgi:hypothetical protein
MDDRFAKLWHRSLLGRQVYLTLSHVLLNRYKGYSNNVIGVVLTLLGVQFGITEVAAHNFSTLIPTLTFAGTVVGQVSFGLKFLPTIEAPDEKSFNFKQVI